MHDVHQRTTGDWGKNVQKQLGENGLCPQGLGDKCREQLGATIQRTFSKAFAHLPQRTPQNKQNKHPKVCVLFRGDGGKKQLI